MSSTFSPFVREGFISSTCSSFSRRVCIFELFLLFEESPYIHHSFLQGKFVVSSLFLLVRKVFSNYTKLVTLIFKHYSTETLGQHIINLLISTHILDLYSSLLYHIPYIKISDFYVLWFIMEHRILHHLYATLVVTMNHCGIQLHVK